ncbi:L-threonylcarbamoyladenylate synthase [Myroides odoratus]|uniref:L-threonylcarbamoyladenylate synthase n=1 Tax=Myroides odoratus TaxID=256 RepID=UPI0039AEA282
MEDIQKEVHKAFEVIKNGGIILYPTDTIWGIGCDATNPEAIKKIYQLKQRAESKSMIVLVNGDRLLHRVFNNIPEVAWEIMEFSTKPTTLILDNPQLVAKEIISEDQSLGVRLVKDPFCFNLIERLKVPLVSTSANLSGYPSPETFIDIDLRIIEGVDYVVNLRQDETKKIQPSTIIKLKENAQVTIIRK